MSINLQVGKSYKTRGGWRARVLYVGKGVIPLHVGYEACGRADVSVVAVHDNPHPTTPPYEPKEVIAFHDEQGRARPHTNVASEPPTFGCEILHPADIIEEI